MNSETRSLVSIVDDDPSVRKSLGRLIESFGLRAETFASTEDYLSAREHEPGNCLILDVHLEGMSGIELQAKLRQSGGTVPIIFITAHDVGEYKKLAMERGAIAFLEKPFGDDVLMEAVRRAIETQRREI
jgi:FixJ family two-component response regulator